MEREAPADRFLLTLVAVPFLTATVLSPLALSFLQAWVEECVPVVIVPAGTEEVCIGCTRGIFIFELLLPC
jgi:hypothetical protein